MSVHLYRLVQVCILIVTGVTLSGMPATTSGNDTWWPEQKAPRSLIRCTLPQNASEAILAASVSGLAAGAVNDDRLDEMVWIQTNRPSYDEWLIKAITGGTFTLLGEMNVWDLVKRYRIRGIIDGYIVYREGDMSVNVATVFAGLTNGVLVEENDVSRAEKAGLRLLMDARDISMQDCFEQNKQRLDNRFLFIIDPKLFNNRDLAIAHKAMVYYGVDDFYKVVLEWMKPLSPVIGWNEGPESGHIEPASRWGLLNTVSDHCINLPFLSCLSSTYQIKKAPELDPSEINWNSRGFFHSFVMSDGDNMQWMMNSFTTSKEYWANDKQGEFPFSWTTCAVNLSMASPVTWNTIAGSKPLSASLVEFGGSYIYPDVFAANRPDRRKVLDDYARLLNIHMKKTGVNTLAFICLDVDSKETLEAFQIFAEKIDKLVGIIAVQYYPYHGGKGELMWVKNKNGINIPVLTSRYSIWSDLNIENAGNPAEVASDINSYMITDDDTGEVSQSMSWTMVHAWSGFYETNDGRIKDAGRNDPRGIKGLTPVEWCIDRLSDNINIVNIEELMWRIRMKYYPEQTEAIIKTIRKK